MGGRTVLILLNLNIFVHMSTSSFVFHKNSNIMFISGHKQNDYFGYSTLLSDQGLLVGAPKGETELKDNRSRWKSKTGSVFLCPFNFDGRQVICQPLSSKKMALNTWFLGGNLKSNSWFGASMVTLPNHRLLITAPRQVSDEVLIDGSLRGACYLLTHTKRNSQWDPFDNRKGHSKFTLDGTRPEYGENNSVIYHDTFGEFGFSAAVTKMNTVVLGAPGLLQFAGGILSYAFDPKDSSTKTHLQPIANPYYTKELEPDDYFGYSVESGLFEKNGSVLYVGGAPRAELGRGKVLLLEPPTGERNPIGIKLKLRGPQVGSYFGASLCSTDLNNDGLDDLLVGAPTYVEKDGSLSYDHGAVFVYIAKESTTGFILEESGYVSGSKVDGARFGTTIADLGDINSDGYRDIAVGAPWENNGVGAVYIYMGNFVGLRDENVQRIVPALGQGFGWSISKGFDVDSNKCNDLAIGAYNSATAYLYRCIPTISVRASIKVTNYVSLPHNATTFTTMFCVSALPKKLWPEATLNISGKIDIDPHSDRARLVGDSYFNVRVTPAHEHCHEKTIFVNITADLMKPIILNLELQAHELMSDESTVFYKDATRLSEDSEMRSSRSVQVLRDCGDDLICSPWLNMTLKALDNPYVPGTNSKFGVRLKVVNEAEPAYGIKVNISLPTHPIRVPSECHIKDLVMTCDLPQSFLRNQSIEWELEMEYDMNVTKNVDVVVMATLSDTYYSDNITQAKTKNVTIEVISEANFIITGRSLPKTAIVFRDDLNAGTNISFKHFFQITNLGPSDRISLPVKIMIPYKTILSDHIEDCEEKNTVYTCSWSVPANNSISVSITLYIDLNEYGQFLQNRIEYNATSAIFVVSNQPKVGPNYTTYEVTTTIILEPASINIWYIIVPCILFGIFLLSIITWILYKKNFFSRKSYNMLRYENNYRDLQNSTQLSDFSSPTTSDEDHEEIDLSKDQQPFEMNI